MTVSKWTVAASKTVLADRWINVRADRVVTGRGVTLDPFYILGYPDWVTIVAITAADELVMVRQYRHGIGQVSLELPAGAVDAEDADPLAAAVRELSEETGYGAQEFRHVSTLCPNPAFQTNRVHTYLALGAEKRGDAHQDPGEEIEVELRPVADVVAGLRSGTVLHALHVAGLLQALGMAGRLPF
jgi:8-oxo-dGTP pyrophosphatase MutT (NUDIX family)